MNDSTKYLNDAGSGLATPKQPQTPSEREAKRKAALAKSNAKHRATNPDYHKNRAAAIKAGTWQGRRGKVSTDAAACSTEPVVAP